MILVVVGSGWPLLPKMHHTLLMLSLVYCTRKKKNFYVEHTILNTTQRLPYLSGFRPLDNNNQTAEISEYKIDMMYL